MEVRNSSLDLMHPSDVSLPRGLEVQSAWIHVPVALLPEHSKSTPVTDLRSTLEGWKSQGMEKASELKKTLFSRAATMKSSLSDRAGTMTNSLSARAGTMKSSLSERAGTMKSSLISRLSTLEPAMRDGAGKVQYKVQHELESNPTRWAGIAAGAGLALGLVGRYLRHRARHHHHLGGIVVIEATC